MPFIGGGGIWSDIYPQLVPHNPTIMGSRVPGIGVGGFSTGGKYLNADILIVKCSPSLRRHKLLSRRHGWDCDDIYGYEVVLAGGEIIYAPMSSHPDPDLWLALKGGSNNFGIVTRLMLRLSRRGLCREASFSSTKSRMS